jgi:hypothetical protein
MITWAEQKPLPKGVLDPAGASLLPQSAENAQPFFVDIAPLAEKISVFSKMLGETPQDSVQVLFEFLAQSVFGDVINDEGFVRPVIDKDRAGRARALIGPNIDSNAIHKLEAVQAAFEALGSSNPFKPPSEGAQKSTEPMPKSKHKQQSNDPVSMGIADFSIAFLNRRFRTASNNTRFEMMWIQDRVPLDEFKPLFPTYQLLGFGTFLMRHDIDNLIAHFTTDGVLDEVAAYNAFSKPPLGTPDTWAFRDGHGTSTLDLMAGAEPGTHDDNRPIYGIELPTAVLLDTSGQKLLAPLLLGLVVIAVTSLFFTPVIISGGAIKGAPVVINASLAFTGGPDNSTETSGFAILLSEVMKSLQTLPHDSLTLTIPTGNHRQDRLHARLDGCEKESIAWGLPPDDNTTSTLEIYVNDCTALKYFALTPPGAAPIILNAAALPQPGFYVDLVSNGEIIARLSHQQGFGPTHYALTTAPTARRALLPPIIPSGTWEINLQSFGPKIDLWVRRDDRLTGFPSAGRQSWFIDQAYLVFNKEGDFQEGDTPMAGAPPLKVFREGSGSVLLDAMNGGANGIVGVAGLQNDGAQPYRFSGERSASGAHAPQEDVAEFSRLLGGPLSATRLSGGVTRSAGTSMASATYARKVADAI